MVILWLALQFMLFRRDSSSYRKPWCPPVIPTNAVMPSGKDWIFTEDSSEKNSGKSRLQLPHIVSSVIFFYNIAVKFSKTIIIVYDD